MKCDPDPKLVVSASRGESETSATVRVGAVVERSAERTLGPFDSSSFFCMSDLCRIMFRALGTSVRYLSIARLEFSSTIREVQLCCRLILHPWAYRR